MRGKKSTDNKSYDYLSEKVVMIEDLRKEGLLQKAVQKELKNLGLREYLGSSVSSESGSDSELSDERSEIESQKEGKTEEVGNPR